VNTDAARAHVDAETMAAWADRTLPAEEAAVVELHLSNCDRCQEVLAAFVRSAPGAGAVILPFWSRRPVQWGAAGLAAAAALVAMIWIGRPPVAPIPESTMASRSVVAESPTAVPTPRAVDQLQDRAAAEKPASAPAELQKQLSRSAREERRQAAANQAAPRKTEGGAAAAPLPAAAPPPPPPAPVPIAAPPPPVTVTAAAPVVSPVATQSVAVRPGALYETTAMDAITVVAPSFEIIAPDPGALASRSAGGVSGRVGVGGGGRGGAAKALTLTPGSTRWRVVAGTRVERTLDAGVTWSALPIKPALKSPLLAGAATSPLNCWLVGREGVVLVTSDGLTFRRVSVPEAVHLTSVTAQDALLATVTAIDGRKFTTIDGGLTWK